MDINKGDFYRALTETRKDDAALKDCIEETVGKLLELDTSLKKPGILLGKVQSGKTRTFFGVIALAFDNGYDIALILTKGTNPLTEQTLKRLHEDFGQFEDNNKVQIHDIMLFPKNMVPYELKQKLIIVAKKETNNLKHVLEVLTTTYPDLKHKKILIIDDEADFASINFRKEKESGLIEQGKIAKQIDEIRLSFEKSDFLQVTATPYSLYLQPDGDEAEPGNGLFPAKRPAFTVLVPTHNDYIGGDYYFLESEKEGTAASFVFEEVPDEELEILKAHKTLGRADRRSFKLEESFTSPWTSSIKKAVMNFIVGAVIRRIQQKDLGEKLEDYSFVIHTEQARSSHDWQEEVVNRLHDDLITMVKEHSQLFTEQVQLAYDNLKRSLVLSGTVFPDFYLVYAYVLVALEENMLVVQTVNSDKDVKSLLDAKGQLKLRTPINIFIGGKIMDRGITIKNMIGFYYGRNPKQFQQDTVLQHSRMYGTRSKGDLAVTRFYTTRRIYQIMRQIHEFDNALRNDFLDGTHDQGVYFIRKDSENNLVPCSPNKLMLSATTTLKAHKRLLPVGFQTKSKTNMKRPLGQLDKVISTLKAGANTDHFLIPVENAVSILEQIHETFDYEDDYAWDIRAHKASLEHLSHKSTNPSEQGKVWVVVRTESGIARQRSDGRFSDDPEGGYAQGPRAVAMKLAEDTPVLILIRVNGNEEKGWRGSPFWWPVIIAPKNTHTAVFASDFVSRGQ